MDVASDRFILGGFVWDYVMKDSSPYNDDVRTWQSESASGDILYLYENSDYKGFVTGHGWYLQLASKDSYDTAVHSLGYPVSEMFNLHPDKLGLGPGYIEPSFQRNVVDFFDVYGKINFTEIEVRSYLMNLVRIMRNPDLDFVTADVCVIFAKISQHHNITDLLKYGFNVNVPLLENPYRK